MQTVCLQNSPMRAHPYQLRLLSFQWSYRSRLWICCISLPCHLLSWPEVLLFSLNYLRHWDVPLRRKLTLQMLRARRMRSRETVSSTAMAGHFRNNNHSYRERSENKKVFEIRLTSSSITIMKMYHSWIRDQLLIDRLIQNHEKCPWSPLRLRFALTFVLDFVFQLLCWFVPL